MPFGPYSTSRSVRCGPSVVRPAAASRARFVAQHRAIAVLHFGRGLLHQGVLDPAVERDAGPRKRRGRIAIARKRGGEPPHRFGARRRDRDRDLRGLMLDRVEPVRVGARLLEQPIARAQARAPAR